MLSPWQVVVRDKAGRDRLIITGNPLLDALDAEEWLAARPSLHPSVVDGEEERALSRRRSDT